VLLVDNEELLVQELTELGEGVLYFIALYKKEKKEKDDDDDDDDEEEKEEKEEEEHTLILKTMRLMTPSSFTDMSTEG